MLRLFVGIKIEPSPILKQIHADLKKTFELDHINWVDPLNYHITLKFLGDVEDYFVNSLTLVLEHIAQKFPIFALKCYRLGYFGKRNQPRIIWYGFKRHPVLDNLQVSVEKALIDLGFEPEEKEFHPHLTLARIKSISNAERLIDYLESKNKKVAGEYRIRDFELIKSDLKSSGPEYTVLREFHLNTSDSLSFDDNQQSIN